MSGNGKLRDKVLEAIRADKLPNRRPERTWGGQGCGARCTICGEEVRLDEVELELEFAAGDGGTERGNYHVHVGCFSAWDFERKNFALQRATIKVNGLSHAYGEATVAAGEREAAAKRGTE